MPENVIAPWSYKIKQFIPISYVFLLAHSGQCLGIRDYLVKDQIQVWANNSMLQKN